MIRVSDVASIKCPHCLVAFRGDWSTAQLGVDQDGLWNVRHTTCPSCNRLVIVLRRLGIPRGPSGPAVIEPDVSDRFVHPKATARAPLSSDVPPELAEDYKEACSVSDSPKASAALSRRCFQRLLREHASVKKADLADEIEQVIKSGQLPSHLAEAIDTVRQIGKFATHPIKSTNTGEIIDVEPGEAEWLLDTLEGLFDHFFVQPKVLARKKAALQKKIEEGGKAPPKKAT